MKNIFHFESYLANGYQIVTINGHRSDPIEVIRGVPQGLALVLYYSYCS